MDHWGVPLYGDPCRECGYTWAAGLDASISLMRSLPDSIDEIVTGATGTERLPDLGWNISGYIAHMTDNTRIWAERLIAVARGADAHVVPYDPDLLAESRHYNDVALQGATWSFRIAVENWLMAVDEADPAESSCCTRTRRNGTLRCRRLKCSRCLPPPLGFDKDSSLTLNQCQCAQNPRRMALPPGSEGHAINGPIAHFRLSLEPIRIASADLLQAVGLGQDSLPLSSRSAAMVS